MDFTTALRYLYHDKMSVEEFADPFMLYCSMSDLCSSSYADKKKVFLFFQINKKLNVVQSILSQNFDFKTKYYEVADLLSESSFQKLICIVKNIIVAEHKEEKNGTQKPQKIVNKTVVAKSEEPKEKKTNAPLTTPTYNFVDDDVKDDLRITGGFILFMAIFMTFAFIFGHSWTTTQWLLITIIGGILIFLTIICLIISCFIDEYYIFRTVVLGICILINFILLLVFGPNYNEKVFICFSIIDLIGGGVLAFLTFYDYEDRWGFIQIAEIVVGIVLLVVGLITCNQ